MSGRADDHTLPGLISITSTLETTLSQATDTEPKLNLSMTAIHTFFAAGSEKPYPINAFRKQWAELDDAAKHQIKSGLTNGSYTY